MPTANMKRTASIGSAMGGIGLADCNSGGSEGTEGEDEAEGVCCVGGDCAGAGGGAWGVGI